MFISMQLISSYDIYKWERHQRKVQLTFASSHLCYLTLSHIYCVYSCSSFRQQWSENWAFPPWRVFMREFITVTVCYDISQSVARNCSFTKPLAQHDIGTTLRRSLHQDHLLDTYFHSLNMPAFVQSLKIHYRALKCNVFTDWTYQSGLVAWLLLFHSLRNSHFSEKQSASLLSRFPAVSDVPLSSGAEGSQGTVILQGGRRGVIWGQQKGNVRAVKHFTFLEAESEHIYLSWEWVRGGGVGVRVGGAVMRTDWPATPLRLEKRDKCDYYRSYYSKQK